MSEMAGPARIGRSIGAVFAGFVAVVTLSIGTDMAMYTAGVFSASGQPMSNGFFLLATAYRTVYGVLGSYITARLAPDRPMQHALVGGLVGLVLSLVGAVVTWNKGPELGPHWYPLALVAVALPQAWLGGHLQGRRLALAWEGRRIDGQAEEAMTCVSAGRTSPRPCPRVLSRGRGAARGRSAIRP